jgi:hypothetical protein
MCVLKQVANNYNNNNNNNNNNITYDMYKILLETVLGLGLGMRSV